MNIQTVEIENYLCYYSTNRFEFSKGLNIILGENGEGKTKFFEALQWLFIGNDHRLDLLVSSKRLSEAALGDSFSVSVSLSVEQYEQIKFLKRSFTVTKDGDQSCLIKNEIFEGIEESKKGEREKVDAETLLQQVFPAEIRKYSMFKGESELNIFDNDQALVNLINLFAEAKHYSKYSQKGEMLLTAAEKAVANNTKSRSKDKKDYEVLQADIKELNRKKDNLSTLLAENHSQLEKVDKGLKEAEKYVDNAEKLDILNSRIANLELSISDHQKQIKERYTTYLFDDNWVLVQYESIFKEYEEKISQLSKERRKLQTEYDKQQGKKEAEREAAYKLFSGQFPLPFNVPDKEIMKELIEAEHCKVCDRPAPKGSEPHDFMKKRLEEYLKLQDPKESEDPEQSTLFEKDYITELINKMNLHNDKLGEVRSIRKKVEDLFDFNKKRKLEVGDLEDKLEKEKEERNRLVGSSVLAEEKLSSIHKNYNGWQDDKTRLSKSIMEYEMEIGQLNSQIKEKQSKKDDIDLESANSFVIKTREIIRDIEIILRETVENKFNEFIEMLQEKSNKYLIDINVDSFTGNIKFDASEIDGKKRIKVSLCEEDRPIHSPNESLRTSMYIAILFAISNLAEQSREEGYPLIFDAPTSSFAEPKAGEFFNIISGTNGQIILLTKDFIGKESQSRKLFIKPEFDNVNRAKAFWLKLERPFDRNQLRTINTNVINV
ncbi:MAG: AAA family ATPase [Cyclobacteriaceae bacterium]